MNKEYKYFRDQDGKICRIHIENDTEPWCPRYDMDGNIGHMMCWWNGYNLGDYKENNYSSPECFLNDLVRNNISEKSIINYVKTKETTNGLNLVYNRKKHIWELWGYWKWWLTGNKVHYGVIESNYPIDFLVDDIIESMSFTDKWKLLEHNGIYYLPLYIYEHSGMTISTGSFSCPWDSGQAGWIYTTKKEIIECGGKFKNEKGNYVKVTDRNWKQAARILLEDEVELYDQYLKGDCYGYIIDELENLEEDEWNENTDSCWGYYSDKWGDKLIEEIALDAVGKIKLYDRLEEIA